MKLTQASTFLLLVGACEAFAPAKFGVHRASSARSLAFDPSVLQDIPNHVHSMQEAFSSMSLSDAAALMDASDVASATGDVAEAAASDNGWFGILTGPIITVLQTFHSALVGAGIKENTWGISIIGITLFIKLLTFPLTKTQLESTNKMQVS
jgi:YidC/Oxa1 family membrane protein insertase